jgi:hypothetical protein
VTRTGQSGPRHTTQIGASPGCRSSCERLLIELERDVDDVVMETAGQRRFPVNRSIWKSE